jgi:hypothetical protein
MIKSSIMRTNYLLTLNLLFIFGLVFCTAAGCKKKDAAKNAPPETAAEEAARRLYTDLAAAAQTQEIRDIFIKLVKEEAEHKVRFELEYDLTTF